VELKKIKLPFQVKKPILALGSQSKNTVCFAQDNLAHLSQIHSDLSDPKDFFNFEKEVKYFLKKHPKIIAVDLHPEYQSSKYAQSLQLTAYSLQLTQHHHAHIASCMIDNALKNQKVIGVAFDGTGLGPENKLWGAEFFICDYQNFQRAAHLREIPLLGGEQAILEPWRLAATWLYLAEKDRFLNFQLDFVKRLDKNKWQVLKKIYLSGFNFPLTSSMGRLFDAVASLVLGKQRANFAAELAIELERNALSYKLRARSYPFRMRLEGENYILDPLPMFKQIVCDLKAGAPKEKIAYRFHLAVAQMIKKACLILRKRTKINKVVLSGGVFQNRLLLGLSLDLLSKEGFKIFRPQQLSPNDSSISLGQAAIANFRGKACA
jgi:hydrogenase maturation protein HypF